MVGKAADADAFDARIGNSADGFEGDAATGLELEFGVVFGTHLDGAAHGGAVHVVQKDDVHAAAAGGEDGFELLQRVHFEFDEAEAAALDVGGAAGFVHGGGDPLWQVARRDAEDVVVLEEDGVVEADAVAVAAAAADGVLLERAPAGRGLAGVKEFDVGALDRLDELGGAGCDAGHAAQEVEHGALGAQHLIHRAGEDRDALAGADTVAILREEGDLAVLREDDHDLRECVDAAEDAGLFSNHDAVGPSLRRDAALGGDIAGAAAGAEFLLGGDSEQARDCIVDGEVVEEVVERECVEVLHGESLPVMGWVRWNERESESRPRYRGGTE